MEEPRFPSPELSENCILTEEGERPPDTLWPLERINWVTERRDRPVGRERRLCWQVTTDGLQSER